MTDVAAEEKIRRLRDSYMSAQDSGDVEECLAHWMEDGVLLPPGEPAVTGTGALRKWFRSHFDQFRSDFKVSFDEIQISGDWSFARGPFACVVIPKAGGEPIEVKGKYLEIYRRQADGSWKFARHMWSSDSPE